MAERELSTRDLAGTSPEDASARDESERVEAPESEAAGEATRPDPAGAPPTDQDRADAVDESRAADVPGDTETSADERGPLLPQEQSEGFVTRWRDIQVGFVDEPRASVAQADALVADLMQRLAAGFSDAREELEAQWDRGDDVSTEDLRLALRRYRAFFDRLLSA
jgi:hypothetical protein